MKNKVAIITGATSMIGSACSKLLSQQGMKLMLAGRSRKKLESLAAELSGDVATCTLNMGSFEEIQAMVNQTVKSFGSIYALVQNVAIYPWKLLEELSVEEWQETLNINLTSAFLTSQACFAEMKKQRSGKLIFMSSSAGEIIGLPHMGAYATSKAGINGLMRTAAIEFSQYNINANSITPGKIYDEQTLSTAEVKEKLRPVPLKRFIKPYDIAQMAAFLISKQGNNITGQNFVIDGGQSILGEEGHI